MKPDQDLRNGTSVSVIHHTQLALQQNGEGLFDGRTIIHRVSSRIAAFSNHITAAHLLTKGTR
jgi:hypothetical protein